MFSVFCGAFAEFSTLSPAGYREVDDCKLRGDNWSQKRKRSRLLSNAQGETKRKKELLTSFSAKLQAGLCVFLKKVGNVDRQTLNFFVKRLPRT